MILPHCRRDIIAAMSEAAVKTPARKLRPKYLSLRALLFEIRLPLPDWVSILHRVSGRSDRFEERFEGVVARLRAV